MEISAIQNGRVCVIILYLCAITKDFLCGKAAACDVTMFRVRECASCLHYRLIIK
jgi:hypothetical protein